jgi:tetratricopeptide (TPR) repeat protein
MNIAIVYDSLTQYDTALAYYERCRVIREQILPTKHPDLASLYLNIANTYTNIAQYDTALAYYERCRAIREQVLPPQHPGLAVLYINMAELYNNQSQFSKAKIYIDKSINIFQQIFPAEHPHLRQAIELQQQLEQSLQATQIPQTHPNTISYGDKTDDFLPNNTNPQNSKDIKKQVYLYP